MIDRRHYSPPDLERRSQWRGKPKVLPLVALILVLVLLFASSGATTEEDAERGQQASGEKRGVMFDCWLDRGPLVRFCVHNTLERR